SCSSRRAWSCGRWGAPWGSSESPEAEGVGRDAAKARRQARHEPPPLFHELSPRAPLDHTALVQFDRARLERSAASWDETAVALGRLRDLALERRGVASDLDAFPRAPGGRRIWRSRVEVPLGVKHLGHHAPSLRA